MYWKSNRGGFLAVASVFLALAIAGLFIFSRGRRKYQVFQKIQTTRPGSPIR